MYPAKSLFPLLPILPSVLYAGRVVAAPHETGPDAPGVMPNESRFSRTTRATDLRKPMELAVTGLDKMYWIKRSGRPYHYGSVTDRTALVSMLNVFAEDKQHFWPVENNVGLSIYANSLGPSEQQKPLSQQVEENCDKLGERVIPIIAT